LEYANFEADINISAIFEIRIRMKRLKSSSAEASEDERG